MNKYDVTRVMRIIRPAIYALYKRQKLRLTKYSMVDITTLDGWYEVCNPDTDISYVLKVEDEAVTYLRTGVLSA